jgi:GNAT superfamily N-acetyltransferase
MSLDGVRIERVKLKDLTALAAAAIDGATPGTFISITKHRAAAMVQNPNATPEDVALLLAKEGDRNVGFFGVMPVMLQHEGKLHKVHWLTTWGVAPDYLGKGLGSRLMEEALALDVDLAIVGSKPARRVAAKYGFLETRPLYYVRIDFGLMGRYNPINLLLRALRKLLSLVGLRFGIERAEGAVAHVVDATLSPLVKPLLYKQVENRLNKDNRTIRAEQVAQVKFTYDTYARAAVFYRSEEVVNWMLAFPWVMASGSSSAELNYGFTDERKGFEMIAWQLTTADGRNLGHITFQSSVTRGRRVLKVLDHQFTSKAPADSLLALAMRQARRVRADVIEGPAELVAPITPSLLIERKQRTLQVHPRAADSPLGRAWQQLEQSYVDGDTAFT